MSALLPASQIAYRSRTCTKCIILHDTHTQAGEHSYLENFLARKGREMGLLEIGYHYLILEDGYTICTRPHDKQGAHCHTYDRESIGIALAGGLAVVHCEPCDGTGVTTSITPPYECFACEGTGKVKQHANTFTPVQVQALRGLLSYLQDFYPEAELKGHTEMLRHSQRHAIKPCPALDMDALREEMKV